MIFISPKTDFAFKKIFGSEQSHEVLLSFLNGILYQGRSIIRDLTILNPYQAPRIRGVKDTYLDVKAKLSSGETVIIEMQVLNVEGFEKRILYNAAKAYSIQLDVGQDYWLLNPVIALTITDFTMFAELDSVTSRFVLQEKDFLIDYPVYDLELVFVELPKFQRSLEELETLTDKWMYFLKHAPDFATVPAPMEDVAAIRQAFALANQATLSREELEELEHQAMFIHDQRNAIIRAEKQALQKGLQQGLQQGAQQQQLEIARRLLPLLDDAAISQTTGLAIASIQALRNP